MRGGVRISPFPSRRVSGSAAIPVSIAGGRDALLGGLRVVSDDDDARQLLEDLAQPDRPVVVSFVNAHAVNLAWSQAHIAECLLQSDVMLRDGKGVQLALRFLGRPQGRNMNGTDLLPRILEAYRGRRVALFGTNSPWLEVARCRIEREYGVSVVAAHHGFEEPDVYWEMAAESHPDLIVLAMGMPKQEKVALLLRERSRNAVLIVNGGAFLDFVAGKVERAPLIMRRAGLEWMFRLAQEPRRLAGRYLIGIPTFFGHLLVLRLAGSAEADDVLDRRPVFESTVDLTDHAVTVDLSETSDRRGTVAGVPPVVQTLGVRE